MIKQDVKQLTESNPTKQLEALSVEKKQRGLTTVEYAVAGALVAATLVAAFTALGLAVANAINSITNVITP